MKHLNLILLAGLIAALSIPAVADDKLDIDVVKRAVAQVMPSATPDAIVPAPMPNFYEVLIGAQVLYVSKDGKYLLEGDVYDVGARQNLTEARRAVGRLKTVQAIDPASMIIFEPKTVNYTLTVFTDIDCGYCRKLHSEMQSYLDKGIRIRYLAYPRSGKNTPSYFKAVGVWCAADRKAALTAAKAGGKVEEKKCNNPVDAHMAAGEAVGVSGTPTLVLENGVVVPGYVNATQLVQLIEENKKNLAAKN